MQESKAAVEVEEQSVLPALGEETKRVMIFILIDLVNLKILYLAKRHIIRTNRR